MATSSGPTGYKPGPIIGQGSFAKVIMCEDKRTGEKVAVKTYNRKAVGDTDMQKKIQNEIEAMTAVAGHEGIVRLIECVKEKHAIHLIMELVACGSLQGFVRRAKRGMGEAAVRPIFGQVASAVGFMHGLGYAHRDLKTENVLFDAAGSACLAMPTMSTACLMRV